MRELQGGFAKSFGLGSIVQNGPGADLATNSDSCIAVCSSLFPKFQNSSKIQATMGLSGITIHITYLKTEAFLPGFWFSCWITENHSWPAARCTCLHLEGPVEDSDSKLRLSMKKTQRWDLGMVHKLHTLFFSDSKDLQVKSIGYTAICMAMYSCIDLYAVEEQMRLETCLA